MEGIAALYGIWGIFLLILAILALLMPFFVFRIRTEIVSINKKMSKLLEILSNEKAHDTDLEVSNLGKRIKRCPFCGAKNRPDDFNCINCGKAMGL